MQYPKGTATIGLGGNEYAVLDKGGQPVSLKDFIHSLSEVRKDGGTTEVQLGGPLKDDSSAASGTGSNLGMIAFGVIGQGD